MTDLFQIVPKTLGPANPSFGAAGFNSTLDAAQERLVGKSRYQSTISSAGLRVADSRIVARLLLEGADKHAWRYAIVEDNSLQIRTAQAAAKIAGLLRARLVLMGPAIWQMISEGSRTLAMHACLAAAIKHSPLLGDYLDLVLREKYRLFAPALTRANWTHFVDDCRGRDPEMAKWSDSTVQSLRAVVHGILANVGYVDSIRTLRLQSAHIAREVLEYLREEREHYVLRCISVHP